MPRGVPLVHDRPFQMRVSEEFLAAIDDWRTKQRPVPSRSEAIRQLVEAGIAAKKPRKGS